MRRAVNAFFCALLVAPTAAAGSRSDDAWSWAQQNADFAWKQLAAGLDPMDPDRSVDWTVQIVATDGRGRTAELHVRKPWDGAPIVTYLRTVGDNVLTQLHDLREPEPGLDVQEAARRLRVRTGTIDAAVCPALGGLAARLSKIQVQALQDSQLTLHAAGFDVTLSPALRSDRRLFVEEGEDDLAKWCAEIVAAVVACEGPPAAE